LNGATSITGTRTCKYQEPHGNGTPMAVAFLGDGMSTRSQQWPWYAILTKTGREKNATLLLENSGFECYLPVSKSSRKWSDRTKEIDVPLFPGYLFCRMNPNDRLPVLITPGVVQIVGTGKTPIPIEDRKSPPSSAWAAAASRRCRGLTCKSASWLVLKKAPCRE